MSNVCVMENVLSAASIPLIILAALLGLILLFALVTVIRLVVLAKFARRKPEPMQQIIVQECKECDGLAKLNEEVDDLKDRVEALENAKPAPVPAPVVIVEKERTLAESLAVAEEVGKAGLISKKSIIAYLDAKYGDKVELNGRKNRTDNGKLLVSDNHFAFAPDGKRVCFTYVYETDEGQVMSLVKLDAPYAGTLAGAHGNVSHSRFPKNKDADWYSVIADDTFTEQGYYDVFDHAIACIMGLAPAAPVEMEEKSLKESLAAAKETGAVGTVSKKSIIAYLDKTFADKVELNGRKNRTDNGKLLVSDNHFAFAPDGKRVCFTYVYEDDDGKVTVLVKTSAEKAQALHAAHGAAVNHSPFPKNKEKDWYSVVVDGSFTEKQVYAFLDDAAHIIIDGAAPAEMEEKSLKESLAAAKETGAVGTVSKKSIIAYLDKTFAEKVELNGRKNRTDNGKLLVSDNHFAFAPGGKRVCFTYVYEDDDGKVTILVKTSDGFAKALRAAHGAAVNRSPFPKNKDKDWYSVIVDDSFTEKQVYALLDDAARLIIGGAVTEAPAAQEMQEKSLKESLAAAKETGAVGTVSKKSIIAYLDKTYGAEKVELNGRKNRTDNGKLLVSDNHFAFAPDGKRVCFTYVYEDDDAKIVILLRLSKEEGKALAAAHGGAVNVSAFPKNKDKDWYSIVVDAGFTERGVYDMLGTSIDYVLSK